MKVQLTRTLKRIVKLKYENGLLKVTANWLMPVSRIKKIICDNIQWINSQKNSASVGTVAESVQRPAPPQAAEPVAEEPKPRANVVSDIFAGRKTVVMGDVIAVKESATGKTYMDGDVLYVSAKFFDARENRLKAIKAYLKKLASLYVADEIANFGSDVSLCPAKIEFRDNSDFWVKCTLASQRILCFDYRIVQLPQNLRRYVIAHAFAHFAHPIHDDGFWKFVANVVPQYRECAKELEKYRLLKEIG